MINVSKNFWTNCASLNRKIQTVPKRKLLVVLPFFGTFSLDLRERLYKSVGKSLPQYNIKVIFQSKNRLSSLFKFKDSISLYLRSHLIFKFQCSNCNISCYCETERHLKVRAGEHIGASPLTGNRLITTKNFPLKVTVFCHVTCIHLMILPSRTMSHTSLNFWLKNLYLLPRINHYWTNKSNHWI